jgi:hypothetical protein
MLIYNLYLISFPINCSVLPLGLKCLQRNISCVEGNPKCESHSRQSTPKKKERKNVSYLYPLPMTLECVPIQADKRKQSTSVARES